MLLFLIGFLIGTITGGTAGVLAIALCVISKDKE